MDAKAINMVIGLIILIALSLFVWVMLIDEGEPVEDFRHVDAPIKEKVHVDRVEVQPAEQNQNVLVVKKTKKISKKAVEHLVEEMPQIEEDKLIEVAPESFRQSADEMIKLARGGDSFSLLLRMWEPGSAKHIGLQHVVNMRPMLSQTEREKLDREMARFEGEKEKIAELLEIMVEDWHKFRKEGNKIYFDHTDEYPDGRKWLFEKDGKWYFCNPEEVAGEV